MRKLVEGALAGELPSRWRHVRRASAQARSLRATGAQVPEVVGIAAIAHDIGYCSSMRDTGFHAIDGARFLRRLGADELIVRLVAHHSCASIEADLRGLTAELADFEPAPADLTDALIYCDMTSGPSGELLRPTERLAEIALRHAGNLIVEEFLVRATGDLLAACARVAPHVVRS